MTGTLYLVATPIGNRQDISARALDILRTVDVVACEDTRHTQKLLSFYGIHASLLSYHEHNERQRGRELIGLLLAGKSVAVVSDAGTPGINDPGHHVTAEAVAAGIRVVPIPGPSAFVAAVVASGLPADTVLFAGFLPSRKGERRRRLAELAQIPATLVIYESPRRLAASLADCLEVLGDRRAAVARELTKIYEEIIRAPLSELARQAASAKIKGEIVLVIERAGSEPGLHPAASVKERVAELESEGMERKAALKAAAKEFGISRSEAYRELQQDGK
jgi:16S rRNA (cytidine1402-2'-O)-methyltransferase